MNLNIKKCTAIVITIAYLFLPNISVAKANVDGIYCKNDDGIKSELAIRRGARNSLFFGINRWFPNGSNVGLYGKAMRVGRGTTYIFRDTGDRQTGEVCEIVIHISMKAASIKEGRGTSCKSYAGLGAFIGEIAFSQKLRHGDVSGVLKNEEGFFNDGTCF